MVAACVGDFVRPKPGSPPTCHLYVANLGPAVGVSVLKARTIFAAFGTITDLQEAGESGNRLYVSFADSASAQEARAALHERPCLAAGGRVLSIQYAELKTAGLQTGPPLPEVCVSGEQVGIPGLVCIPDFVSEEEERELVAAVDDGNWHRLAKRRVQHYGYEFKYQSRNVDPTAELGAFPPPLQSVSQRVERLLTGECEQVCSEDDATGGKQTEAEQSWPLDQLTVNEYPAGVGLSPHVDTHSAFHGAIVSLSLAGPTVMEFRRQCQEAQAPDGSSSTDTTDGLLERRCLFLAPRSLLVLTGEARYAWQHYIPHRKSDLVRGEIVLRGRRRVSLTFRKVRTGPCRCEYPESCDSQQGVREGGPKRAEKGGWMRMEGARESGVQETGEAGMDLATATDKTLEALEALDVRTNLSPQAVEIRDGSTNTSRSECLPRLTPEEGSVHPLLSEESSGAGGASPFVVPEIEKRHVHQVYDAIAMHFSATRFAKWPKVAQFLEGLPEGSLVVDAGCGNGKYLGFNPSCFFLGCDISAPLVGMASKRGFDVAVADALRLPYRTASCDAAISIAVLHHLSSDARRRQAIRELLRIVKSGDRILITVWAREQEDPKLLGKWTPLIGTEAWPEDLVAPGGKQPGDRGSAQEQASGVEGLAGERTSEEGRGSGRKKMGLADRGGNEVGTTGEGTENGHGPSDASESPLRERRPSGTLESIPESGAGAPKPDRAANEVKVSMREGEVLLDPAENPDSPPSGSSAQADTSIELSEASEGSPLPGDGSGSVQEYFVPWHLPYHRVEIGVADRDGERGLARRDPLKQALVYERYYHVFVEGELERLVNEVGGCTIVDHFFDKSNWCVIAAKH
ncbi:hypothetical protein KFL_002490140 [Klebsormidium nitens]|uniref:tRNA (carboxymethyluridine(34)-5-O)-methyltransferase n=1 Tax=Klebsormidium nitens TaxID=105231 RepID=A0A1Y1IAH4_KLENI|nr:hypothetical protein KFL_002490140 [Klebsormidium nitens]|eukprot:GAQ85696.1 hypothetical protein KFL_002490140 [Klebsormidium nitens]